MALWLSAVPPTHPPPARHVFGLPCCLTPAPLHHESPLAQNPLDGRGLLRNCAARHSNVFVSSAIPKNPTAPTFFEFTQFYIFCDSREFCKSWCHLLGCRPEEKVVKQMIVREWLAVNGTHPCESVIFCGAFSPNLCGRGLDLQENGSGLTSTPAGQFAHSQLPAQRIEAVLFLCLKGVASSC